MDSFWAPILSIATLGTLFVYIFYFYEIRKQTKALQNQVDELLKKPELDVEFDYSKLDSVDIGPYSEGEGRIIMYRYKNVRVKVINNGKATAEECIAKAEIMAYESPELKDVKPSNLLEPVILHWTRNLDTLTTKLDQIDYSNENKFERLFKPISIAVGDYEFADLIIIGKEELDQLSEDQYAIVRCNLNPNIKPVNDNLWLKVDEIIKVIIYCSNGNSKSLCLKVKKIPIYDDISSGKKDEYFEEIECPKLKS